MFSRQGQAKLAEVLKRDFAVFRIDHIRFGRFWGMSKEAIICSAVAA
jgi:hypothetical protein